MTDAIELILRTADGDDDAAFHLCSPGVGLFTEALADGCAVSPGAKAGVLLAMARSRELRIPAGVMGRVLSTRPERVQAPVGYGDVLYAIAPFADDMGTLDAVAGDAAGGPGLRAPYAGRFWTRPAPTDPAFVEPGTILESGAVVGLIEVMKTFTQIHYEGPGLPSPARVVRVLPDDGSEIASGELLIEVEPA